jgi:hypothetical protein
MVDPLVLPSQKPHTQAPLPGPVSKLSTPSAKSLQVSRNPHPPMLHSTDFCANFRLVVAVPIAQQKAVPIPPSCIHETRRHTLIGIATSKDECPYPARFQTPVRPQSRARIQINGSSRRVDHPAGLPALGCGRSYCSTYPA